MDISPFIHLGMVSQLVTPLIVFQTSWGDFSHQNSTLKQGGALLVPRSILDHQLSYLTLEKDFIQFLASAPINYNENKISPLLMISKSLCSSYINFQNIIFFTSKEEHWSNILCTSSSTSWPTTKHYVFCSYIERTSIVLPILNLFSFTKCFIHGSSMTLSKDVLSIPLLEDIWVHTKTPTHSQKTNLYFIGKGVCHWFNRNGGKFPPRKEECLVVKRFILAFSFIQTNLSS